MDVSQLTLKLIILLIPGAIASIMVERLTVHKPWDSFRFIISCILLGVLSYFMLQATVMLIDGIGYCFHHPHWVPYLTVWGNLGKEGNIPYIEVALSCIAAVIIGFIVSKGDNDKWLIKAANRLKASDKYGDESLYYNFMRDERTTYVYVRNVGEGVTYAGEVESYEDSDTVVEMVLINAKVYQSDSVEELYSSDRVYLNLLKEKVIIEYADTTIDESVQPNNHEQAANQGK